MKRKRSMKWILISFAGIVLPLVILISPLLMVVSALAVGIAGEGSNAATQPEDKPSASIGNGDIVAVAQAEIGNEGGEKYWKWYGYAEWVDWCACFISWCGNQCGYIATGVLPKFSSVNENGIPWFQERGLWAGRGYTPSPGDIVFIDWDNDGTADHVELVERVEGTTVYTIGGNRDGGKGVCGQGAYKLGSGTIYGYGTPNYRSLLWPTPDCKVIKKTFFSTKRYLAIGPATNLIDVTGLPIIAAKTGTVTQVSQYNNINGYWSIEVSHGKGDMVTIYDRCLSPQIEKGDTVTAGQVIASMAAPTAGDDVSLEFTVLVDGTPVDPIESGYLSQDGLIMP